MHQGDVQFIVGQSPLQIRGAAFRNQDLDVGIALLIAGKEQGKDIGAQMDGGPLPESFPCGGC